MIHRFGPNGLDLLNEPEAALLARRIGGLVGQGSQFIVATHSPILLAVSDARILQVDIDGTIEQVDCVATSKQ